MDEILKELYSYLPPFETSACAQEPACRAAEDEARRAFLQLSDSLDETGRALLAGYRAAVSKTGGFRARYAFREGLRMGLAYIQTTPAPHNTT